MSRAGPLAAALLALLAGPASAQPPQPQPGALPGVADVPAGPGTLRVRVEHPGGTGITAGLPVVLYALSAGEEPGLRRGVTDPRGELIFEGLSTDPETAYLVGVHHAGVPFGDRAHFAPGEQVASLVLRISDPSPETAEASIGEVELRIEPACRGIQVVESYELRNAGERVIHVAEDARGDHAPVFETELPEGAETFAAALPGLEQDAGRVRFWGPLHPGSQRVEFSYGVAEPGPVLQRSFATGAPRLVVRSGSDAPRVLEPVVPGEPVELELEPLADVGPPAGLALHRSQMWLELDDAALRADERHEIETLEGAEPKLLCLELPEGAEQLRFSSASLALGLFRDPSGALAVRGPFPAGRWILALRYLLPNPNPGGELRLARRFPLDLPLLTLYVADTGIRAESGRLHRRRPVLSEDRHYMHFEAFGVAAGEAVPLALRAVPLRRRAPTAAVLVFVGLAGAAALVFLGAPLRGSRAAASERAEAPGSVEREAVEAALRDLEHDFETGKLAPEDYRTFGRELRERAAALRREELRPTPSATPAPRPGCPECGAAPAPKARFCSQCGAPLEARAAQ